MVYGCDGPGCGFEGTLAEVTMHPKPRGRMPQGATGWDHATGTWQYDSDTDDGPAPAPEEESDSDTTWPRDSIDTTTRPRKRMKENGSGDQITRETPLTKGILPRLSEETILKFADEEISTVGQVADFPADPRAWKNI